LNNEENIYYHISSNITYTHITKSDKLNALHK